MSIEDQYFQTWHIILYLIPVFVCMVVYFQWKWSKECDQNIQVLEALSGGGGAFYLAPKSGGSIEIKNPHNDTVRLWALNELATIEVPYPGVGFVPKFLQKTIRLAIISEGDWEPMLNRSKHIDNVASPNVVAILESVLALENLDAATRVRTEAVLANITTSPTREMIASPAVLGNLMNEKITEAVITVNKEMLDSVAGLINKLSNLVSSKLFFMGIGAVILVLIILGFLLVPILNDLGALEISSMNEKLDTIRQALGVQ